METTESVLPEQGATERSIIDEINRIEGEINECKALLLNTDWCVIKCQETGQRIEEVYPDENASRAKARIKINELETLVNKLFMDDQIQKIV